MDDGELDAKRKKTLANQERLKRLAEERALRAKTCPIQRPMFDSWKGVF